MIGSGRMARSGRPLVFPDLGSLLFSPFLTSITRSGELQQPRRARALASRDSREYVLPAENGEGARCRENNKPQLSGKCLQDLLLHDFGRSTSGLHRLPLGLHCGSCNGNAEIGQFKTLRDIRTYVTVAGRCFVVPNTTCQMTSIGDPLMPYM